MSASRSGGWVLKGSESKLLAGLGCVCVDFLATLKKIPGGWLWPPQRYVRLREPAPSFHSQQGRLPQDGNELAFGRAEVVHRICLTASSQGPAHSGQSWGLEHSLTLKSPDAGGGRSCLPCTAGGRGSLLSPLPAWPPAVLGAAAAPLPRQALPRGFVGQRRASRKSAMRFHSGAGTGEAGHCRGRRRPQFAGTKSP